MQRVTIITNTIRRSLELVSKSIESSLSQNNSVEVILIDQNNKQIEFPDEIKKNPRFKQVHYQVPSVSMARNHAEYSSKTEWLIFCDDDGYLDSEYIKNLMDLIQRFPEVEIFAGGIKRIDNGDFYSKRHAIGGDMKWFWNSKLLMGSNFVIKKNVFESLGKFDENYGAGSIYGSSEETDLAWNAFFQKKKMRFSPELIVFHVPPYTKDVHEEVKKSFKYGIGKGALVRKWIMKGHFLVFLELGEMFVLPLLRAPFFVIFFQFKELFIQISSVLGRLLGLFTMRKSIE